MGNLVTTMWKPTRFSKTFVKTEHDEYINVYVYLIFDIFTYINDTSTTEYLKGCKFHMLMISLATFKHFGVDIKQADFIVII